MPSNDLPLSAPIFMLKRRARLLSRRSNVPLHEALDTIARDEGYRSWSLLSARAHDPAPARRVLDSVAPGQLILLGARPGQGKTLLALEMALLAIEDNQRAWFFSLEYNDADLEETFALLGRERQAVAEAFRFDSSDAISATYIAEQLEAAQRGDVVIVDYLQALDHRRDNPDLQAQMQTLRAFAESRELLVICISQIDRSWEPGTSEFPDLKDVRLPNPLDLKVFDRACFMNRGEVRLTGT